MESLIFIAVAAGIAGLATFIIRAHKRQQAELKSALAQIGFQAVPQLDAKLEESLKGMSGSIKVAGSKLTNVYKYSGMNYDLYRFDVPDKDSRDIRYVMDFRRDMFPAFATVPQVKLPGLLGSVVGKLFQLAIGRMELKEVDVPGKPRFSERYRLFGADPRQLLSMIPAHIWERFAELPGHLLVSGQGRVLSLTSVVSFEGSRRYDPARDVRNTVEAAESVWRVFSEVESNRIGVRV